MSASRRLVTSLAMLAYGLSACVALDPCRACHTLTDSFQHWLERTARGKHEGGDAHWEESKLRSYSRSELRLVEIQEGLCSELRRHERECYALAERAELPLERWWFREDPATDLHSWLCVDALALCCPRGRYGADCTRCPRGVDGRSCSGRGRCHGDGTRKGTGECECDEGYSGDACDRCAADYYQIDENGKLSCDKCHMSCEGGCDFSGTNGCHACAGGWNETDKGCVDVDECAQVDACMQHQYCVNEEGSHACLDCDKSCESCSGRGAWSCLRCAEGYVVWSESCVDVSLRDLLVRRALQRLLLYIGLFVITCFVFRKSKTLAAVVVVVVSVYIFYAEYMINDIEYFGLKKILNVFKLK